MVGRRASGWGADGWGASGRGGGGGTLIDSQSSLPGLKNGYRLGSRWTGSPVFGFRQFRSLCFFTLKVPKPRISIRSPSFRAWIMLSKIMSIVVSMTLRDK